MEPEWYEATVLKKVEYQDDIRLVRPSYILLRSNSLGSLAVESNPILDEILIPFLFVTRPLLYYDEHPGTMFTTRLMMQFNPIFARRKFEHLPKQKRRRSPLRRPLLRRPLQRQPQRPIQRLLRKNRGVTKEQLAAAVVRLLQRKDAEDPREVGTKRRLRQRKSRLRIR